MNLTATQSNSASTPRAQRAFTPIELLVVVAIIATLAAMTIAGLHYVSISNKVSTATGELKDIESAIQNYHAAYGVYPPGNAANTDIGALTNQLYYELTGVIQVVNGGTTNYQLVDGSTITPVAFADAFGAAGILNCTRAGGGEDTTAAKNFLTGLKPNRVATITNNGSPIHLLVTTVNGPDDAY